MLKFLQDNPELVNWLMMAGFALLGYFLRAKGIGLPAKPAIPATPAVTPGLPAVPVPAPVLPVAPLPSPLPAIPGNPSSAEALLLANGHPIAAMLLRLAQGWLPEALKGVAPVIAADTPKPAA